MGARSGQLAKILYYIYIRVGYCSNGLFFLAVLVGRTTYKGKY